MRGRNRLLSAGLLAGVMVLASSGGVAAQADEKPKLPTVRYAELGKMVRALEGKVVVVYFWADY